MSRSLSWRWRRGQRLQLIDEAAFSSVDNGFNDTMLAAINDVAKNPLCYLSYEKRICCWRRDTVDIA